MDTQYLRPREGLGSLKYQEVHHFEVAVGTKGALSWSLYVCDFEALDSCEAATPILLPK